MWGMGSDSSSQTTKPHQEYTIKEVSIKCRCGFHDGYDRDCFDSAVYSLDATPMCAKHLHIRMRAITMLALQSPGGITLSYNIK